MRNGICSILFVLILAASHAAQVKPPTGVEVIPDVVYGHKDGMALTFDIFKPKAQANGAAIVFMVSGGWVSNYIPPEQAMLRYQELLDAGFTVITLRHGGSPKYLIPEIVADVRRAFDSYVTMPHVGALIRIAWAFMAAAPAVTCR